MALKIENSRRVAESRPVCMGLYCVLVTFEVILTCNCVFRNVTKNVINYKSKERVPFPRSKLKIPFLIMLK
jgi:hypothetical protein